VEKGGDVRHLLARELELRHRGRATGGQNRRDQLTAAIVLREL